ncbi:MAG: sterol desaturase family protein [Bacteroidota bacterium]
MSLELPYYFPFIMNFARYFLMAGIPFLIFYILFPEKFSAQKIQARYVKRKELIHEVLHSLKTIGIFIATGLIVLNTELGGLSQMYESLDDYPLWWIPISILLAMFVYDTYFYWLHRAMHHKKLFRWTHLVHHKSTNPTPLATYSFNIAEAFFEAMMALGVIMLIPLHTYSLLLLVTLTFAFNVYAHLGYEVMPRWFRHSFLFECLNTSVHHNLHHHKFKGNYGLYFRFWDRLMGTEHPDYVKTYDQIQLNRFGEYIIKEKRFLKRLFFPLLILLVTFMGATPAEEPTLLGTWRDDVGGGIVKIYHHHGLYHGKLIGSTDPEKDQRVKSMNFLVLENFRQKDSRNFCCGTLAHPRYSFKVDGAITLQDASTLLIEGKVGFINQTRIWKKID